MSQDLFAAFAEPSDSHAATGRDEASSRSKWDPPSSKSHVAFSSSEPQPEVGEKDDTDDDFGDFEDASASAQTGPVSKVEPKPVRSTNAFVPQRPGSNQGTGRHPFADHMDFLFAGDDDEYDAGDDDMADLSTNPEAAMAFSKRVIAEQTAAHIGSGKPAANITVPSTRSSQFADGPKTTVSHVAAKDPQILFDADDVSETDDDEFGDFTSATPRSTSRIVKQPQNHPPTAEMDLLGLSDEPPAAPTASKTCLKPGAKSYPNNLAKPKTHTTAKPVEKANTIVDDEWDDFEEATPTSNATTSSASVVTVLSELSQQTSQQQKPIKATLPPTNIPPPMVLLSIFPQLLTDVQKRVLDQSSQMGSASRQEFLSHEKTHSFINGQIIQAVALGHIVAGRKLRWKRDKFLAQSMSIGPAGGKGGMKLTGLDKSELAKEDREVLDVVRQWKAYVGKFRSFVSTARPLQDAAGRRKLRAVPEVAEQMPVKILKPTEGGITAPHACRLCGLKREERVGKVDVDVEDSFGEWWVDKMDMHSDCRTFWHVHQDRLKSR